MEDFLDKAIQAISIVGFALLLLVMFAAPYLRSIKSLREDRTMKCAICGFDCSPDELDPATNICIDCADEADEDSDSYYEDSWLDDEDDDLWDDEDEDDSWLDDEEEASR